MRFWNPRPDRTSLYPACLLRRFGRDARGTTAVEFAMVAAPFLALTLAIMTIGMQYLALHSLEQGVAEASRKLRTGEAQKGGLTLADFRSLFCDAAGSFIACDNRLVVHIKSGTAFSDLSPLTNCVTNGALTPAVGSPNDGIRTRSGDASSAVLVTVCYDWQMGSNLWQTLWNVISPVPVTEQGKTIISAATAFRSEPFE